MMRRHIFGWWGLIILTAALTVACGLVTPQSTTNPTTGSAPATDCRRVSHELGETEICGQPQNVVVFGLHNLGLLLSVDVQPMGFALDVVDLFGEEIFDNPVQQVPYLGDRLTTQPVNLGSSGQPSLEKLTEIAPDLILGNWFNAQSYNIFSQTAPTLLMGDSRVAGQWQENLRAIAQALGKEEQAEAAIARHAAKVAETRAALADAIEAYPKLLVISASRLNEGISAIGSNSYLGELLEAVGFELVTPPIAEGQFSAPVSLESLPELDEADNIILLGYNQDFETLASERQEKSAARSLTAQLETHQIQTIQTSWQENPIAQALTASQENRVYFATYAGWSLLNNPMGAESILQQLQRFFASP